MERDSISASRMVVESDTPKQEFLSLGHDTTVSNLKVGDVILSSGSPAVPEYESKQAERLERMKRRMSETSDGSESESPSRVQLSDLFGDVSFSSGADETLPSQEEDGNDSRSSGLEIDLGPGAVKKSRPGPKSKSKNVKKMNMTPPLPALTFDQLSPTTQFVMTIEAGCPNPVVTTGCPNPVVTTGCPNPVVTTGCPNPVVTTGCPNPVVTTGCPNPVVTTGCPNPVVTTGCPNPVVTTGCPNPVVTTGCPNPVVTTGGPNPVVTSGCPNPVVTTGLLEAPILGNSDNFEHFKRQDTPSPASLAEREPEKSKAVLKKPNAVQLQLQQNVAMFHFNASRANNDGIEWDLQAELMYHEYVTKVVLNMAAQKGMWDQLQKYQVGVFDPPLSLHAPGKGCCLVDPKRSCQVVRRAKSCFLLRARVLYEFLFPHVSHNERWLRQVVEKMWSDSTVPQREMIYYDKSSFFHHRTLSLIVKYPPGQFERAFFANYFPKGVPIDPEHLIKLPSPPSDDPALQQKYEFFVQAFKPKELNTETLARRHWMEALQNKETAGRILN